VGHRGANYEYASRRRQLQKLIKIATPDAEIVGEQFPALGKIDAGATVAALENTKPDAFSMSCSVPTSPCSCARQYARLFEAHGREPADGSQSTSCPRRGTPRLDRHRLPWEQITDPAHKAFVDAYKTKYNIRRDSARCSATLSAT